MRFGRCDLYADDEDMSTFSQCLCEIFCKTFHNLCAYALLELVVGGHTLGLYLKVGDDFLCVRDLLFEL